MKRVAIVALLVFIACLFCTALRADEAPRMTKEQLKAQLGNPDVVIIDVRVPQAWNAAKDKIKGAVRGDPTTVDSWINTYPKDKTYVFYCN
jgi:rhodanese-related sulfurtransferase